MVVKVGIVTTLLWQLIEIFLMLPFTLEVIIFEILVVVALGF
jgi:hypothetical protein